jgi:hypothetical protein
MKAQSLERLSSVALIAALVLVLLQWLPLSWYPSAWSMQTERAVKRSAIGVAPSAPLMPSARKLKMRPLFDPERGLAKPMTAAAQTQQEAFAESYDLRGVLRTPTAMIALIEHKATQATQRLAKGQAINNWQLTEINAETVTFINGATRAVFKLETAVSPPQPKKQ